MTSGNEHVSKYDINAQNTLRNVFTSGQGPEALNLILRWLGYFDVAIERKEMPVAEAIARRNFAVELLERLGVFHTDNTKEIVDSLMQIPPKPDQLTSHKPESGDMQI